MDEQQRRAAARGPVSSTFTRRPSSSTGRCSAGQSTSSQVASSPSAYVSSAPGLSTPLRRPRRVVRVVTPRRTTVSTACDDIAIDIDSTLHHYWDQLAAAARRRFGVDLPYEDQVTWEITLLRPSRCARAWRRRTASAACSPPSPTPARSRPSAPGTRRATSSTSPRTGPGLPRRGRALAGPIGLPYDELYCSYDKVARCAEIGIDVLIDDSPGTSSARSTPASTAATLLHPWNRELCETEDVICGAGLARARAATSSRCSRDRRPALPAAPQPTCATTCPRSSRTARSPTGAAPSASRACSTGRSTSFLYHYWFRCEVEGIEHVPATGGALLVANHAGALPPDASMIAKAIKEEHPRPRPLHLTVEHFFKGYPFFSMFVAKIGGVPAHPANVQRLLHDEQQLVLVFPEGAKATEKLYKDRYKLRRFGRGGFVEAAMRAGVPIVPVAVVGAEEAMPTFAQVGLLKRLTGLLYFPVTPLFPHFGLLGAAYLPAKFKLRFLEPVPTDRWAREPWDPGLVQDVAERSARRIQDELVDMVAHRRSVWLGMRRRVLITGLSTYWGGRLAQALERDPEVEVIVGVSPGDPTCELTRTGVRPRRHQHALLRRIVAGRGDRHGGRHAADRRLGHGELAARRTRTT